MMKNPIFLWIAFFCYYCIEQVHSSYSCSLDNNADNKSASLLKSFDNYNIFLQHAEGYSKKYGTFSESLRLQMKEEARKMFQFGYDSYLKYAFPKDELNPIYCTGRGPDYENP